MTTYYLDYFSPDRPDVVRNGLTPATAFDNINPLYSLLQSGDQLLIAKDGKYDTPTPDPLTEITKVLDMQAETMKNLMEVVAELRKIVETLVTP